MIRFYYTCPRCGRVWARFIPRSRMKCPFCSERWETSGKRGTRSKFSWKAVVFWLFWILVVVSAVNFQTIREKGNAFLQTRAEKKQQEKVPFVRPKVPDIKFRSPEEIEKEKERQTSESQTSVKREQTSEAQETVSDLIE